jgi:hypothetical protein
MSAERLIDRYILIVAKAVQFEAGNDVITWDLSFQIAATPNPTNGQIGLTPQLWLYMEMPSAIIGTTIGNSFLIPHQEPSWRDESDINYLVHNMIEAMRKSRTQQLGGSIR